jgi:hypothetical protein
MAVFLMRPNVPVQRRAAQRTVRCNRLFGGASPIQPLANTSGLGLTNIV